MAVANLVATVAIPLMTKAVIDGPVRHHDQRGLWVLGAAAMGVGVSEALLWFIRRRLLARGAVRLSKIVVRLAVPRRVVPCDMTPIAVL